MVAKKYYVRLRIFFVLENVLSFIVDDYLHSCKILIL